MNNLEKKVLITDDVHPLLIAGLEANGFHCDYEPNITDTIVRQKINIYNGLIINSKINVDAAMLDAAAQLEFVARIGAGMEIVDLAHARARGVAVVSAPEGNRNAVAEHALGMLLALANQLPIADAEVRQKIWKREARRGFELAGKTVGIVGFGHTGSAFALRLAGLDVKILAYDKYRNVADAAKLWQTDATEEPQYFWKHNALSFDFVQQVSLETLQQEADIISFHLPLNAETKYFCDEIFLKNCKKKVVIINTSRGNVVETAALLAALTAEKVRFAALDVFENEKVGTFSAAENLLYDDLYRRPNVLLSPHVAGWTTESKARLASVLLKKILNIQKSKN
ncbi:MAG: D-isomer specific 2-hydroxyacid dehydrogenase NAD-binding protein [Bacteroidota bacterium]|jgi:D-3-phosphoglycerate dehydrogenase